MRRILEDVAQRPCAGGTRHGHLALFALLAAGLAACESSPNLRLPNAPSPQPTPVPPPALYTLSGAVTAGGRPAVGARVAVLEIEPEPSTTTDMDGRYRIPGLPASSTWGRSLVRFSQAGYFTEFKRPNIPHDLELNVAMEPLVFIDVGEVVQGTVRAGTTVCAGKDYEEDACERFALLAALSGTLEATLTAPSYVALDVVNAEGEAVAEFFGSPIRVRIPARAGSTYELRVVTTEGATADFKLSATVH